MAAMGTYAFQLAGPVVNDPYVGCLKSGLQKGKGATAESAAAKDIGFGMAHAGTDSTVYEKGQSLNCE